MTAKSGAQRVKETRLRHAAAGYRLIQVWITPADAARLDVLKASGMTVADVVRAGITSGSRARPRQTPA